MDCENYSESSDDRFINQQEHRNVSRLWEKTINKFSSTKFVLDENGNNAIDICTKGNNLNVNTDYQGNCPGVCDEQLTSDFVQKKLARGKSFAKKKSPLQKFDEVVSRELLVSFNIGMPAFESTKKWSSLQFPKTTFADISRGKIPVNTKFSKSTIDNVEKDIKDDEKFEVENSCLMEAIEKLAQVNTHDKKIKIFDAAVKAAEAAIASVPPEKAEEVAVAFAKDYQSEIVDVINEKIPMSEEKKPIEVIGYIGVTKMKDCNK
ncbi:hypothetical protein Phum_PHUM457940 [Pediculus humanus corporis]|uniref:Uncharacterized protein n=1 Tax=Pediculus humanus subsp. corporis TaxID=121224 RepID=E0VV25_PEDHC|nr:uncharacterized protein Phum_PHUM457940 [Pediculus humanus corporis]EEB17231.1 hypothetical protein Phum_PHUM457940 [Pediculus humanus corporis]